MGSNPVKVGRAAAFSPRFAGAGNVHEDPRSEGSNRCACLTLVYSAQDRGRKRDVRIDDDFAIDFGAGAAVYRRQGKARAEGVDAAVPKMGLDHTDLAVRRTLRELDLAVETAFRSVLS